MITLYLKRNNSAGNIPFTVFDSLGNEKYFITLEKTPVNTVFRVFNKSKERLSKIIQNNLISHKFFISSNKQKIFLTNSINSSDCDLYLYGTSWYITGNAVSGNYALLDVDKSIIMTQKRIWASTVSYSEINITNQSFETLAISVAVCINLYISSAERKNDVIPNI